MRLTNVAGAHGLRDLVGGYLPALQGVLRDLDLDPTAFAQWLVEQGRSVACISKAAGSPQRLRSPTVFGDAPYGLNDSDTAQFDATLAFIDSIHADPDV